MSARRTSINIDKNTFTPGEIAHLLGVSPRTAGRIIDSGELKGYKIVGSGKYRHRKVTKDMLISFAKKHNIEHVLKKLQSLTIFYGVENSICSKLEQYLVSEDHNCINCNNILQLGEILSKQKVRCIVFDYNEAINNRTIQNVKDYIDSKEELNTKLVVIGYEDSDINLNAADMLYLPPLNMINIANYINNYE